MDSTQNVEGGSKMDGTQGGRGKNKRFWSRDEEWALVNGLLELSLDPKWRAEGNFKNGFLVKLESILNEKCPNCALKASPHIDSKYKWLRDKYNVISEMLRTSGFSWDDTTKTVKCERQAFEDFCKNHKAAKGLWGVPFPFLEELDKVFGADRATGVYVAEYHVPPPPPSPLHSGQNKSMDLDKDADEETHREDDNDEDESVTQLSPHVAKKARTSLPLNKGKRPMTNVVDLTSTLNNVVGYMSGLTRKEARMAVKKLEADEHARSSFYNCPHDEWKKEFIIELVRSD